jgi:hypothetical protein
MAARGDFHPQQIISINRVKTPDFAGGCTSEARAGRMQASNHYFMREVPLELAYPMIYQ